MKYLFPLLMLGFLTACQNQSSEDTANATDNIRETPADHPKTVDTTFKDRRFIKGVSEMDVFKELIEKYNFNNYPITCEEVPLKEEPTANSLKGITEGSANRVKMIFSRTPPNFNCTYHAISVANDANERFIAIYNATTGEKVATHPVALGAKFERNSNLLIINPPMELKKGAINRDSIGAPKFFVLKNDKLQKVG